MTIVTNFEENTDEKVNMEKQILKDVKNSKLIIVMNANLLINTSYVLLT